MTETAEHVIVRFRWDDDEGDDWIEGQGLLDPLLDARGELAAGDTRLLYLGWLLKVQLGGLNEDDDEGLEDEAEPPIPAGLRELSDSLASVAGVLKTDKDLIAAAAEASGPLVPLSDGGIADWVTALPASEKDKFLTMVAEGEGAQGRGVAAGGEADRVLQAERVRPGDTAPDRPARGRAAGGRHRGVHGARVRELRTRYAKRPSLMERFDKARLPRLE
ncbi:MAG: hypothetical protein M0030_04220 [Actinomycetota bacterium]|nr:hypothetical protein [Actinomycetota bacterium]